MPSLPLRLRSKCPLQDPCQRHPHKQCDLSARAGLRLRSSMPANCVPPICSRVGNQPENGFKLCAHSYPRRSMAGQRFELKAFLLMSNTPSSAITHCGSTLPHNKAATGFHSHCSQRVLGLRKSLSYGLTGENNSALPP